jgi:hypothetical protein
MNDDELITAVRESFTDIHSSTPAEQIVSRSRTIRARRRIPGAAGALAVVAGAALAVTTLLPASHQASHPAHAQLASWTVAKQADGSIRVTIRELRDPSQLQRKLRADGIPASVSVARNPACQGYPTSGTPAQRRAVLAPVFQLAQSGYSSVIIIHPSALPTGTGVVINAAFQPRAFGFGVGLVQASQQCTGS